jgi:hypothetical protein
LQDAPHRRAARNGQELEPGLLLEHYRCFPRGANLSGTAR